MVVIGITGQTGAGKTTALRALSSLGGHTIDCDQLYHHLLATHDPLRRELEERFGDLSDEGGAIDRKKLGAIVFADPAALEELSTITLRHIMVAVEGEIQMAVRAGYPAVAIDAIRLVESGLSALCHRVVAITASQQCRVERIMAREGISQAYATARVTAQAPEEFYIAHADFVLSSDGSTPQQLEGRARDIFTQIISTLEEENHE